MNIERWRDNGKPPESPGIRFRSGIPAMFREFRHGCDQHRLPLPFPARPFRYGCCRSNRPVLRKTDLPRMIMHMQCPLGQHQRQTIITVDQRNKHGSGYPAIPMDERRFRIDLRLPHGRIGKPVFYHSGFRCAFGTAPPLPIESTGRFSGSKPNLAMFPPDNTKRGHQRCPLN